jgi:hypothetical protein
MPAKPKFCWLTTYTLRVNNITSCLILYWHILNF